MFFAYTLKGQSDLVSTQETIKILFLAANPQDIARLQIDEEMRAIDQALRMTEYRDQFDLRSHWAVRYGDLQELLLRHKPDIVHFSGHGSPAGEILLQSDSGVHPVSAEALSTLFRILKDNVRCVVLNACYSEVQAHAIADQIDCVIGMWGAIGDPAAINFASAFYQALGYGRSVQEAFALGCNVLDLANLADKDKPRLLALHIPPTQVLLGKSPYKGLQFFDVDDAGIFFGCERLTAELVAHLRRHRFLAIVGASGSGKSSLVRAGLVSALQRGEPLADGTLPPKGSKCWPVHILFPTARPLESLALSLTRDVESVTATDTLIEDLRNTSRSLHLYVGKLLMQKASARLTGDHLLLVVDQFENCSSNQGFRPNGKAT
jgi:hypothetical protein